MDEVNKIKKAFADGESKNAIAVRFRRSWETIDRIVSIDRESLKNRGKRPKRKPTVVTDEILQEINRLLDEEIEKKIKKKQRYTARMIFKILKAEETYLGSERRIQDTVCRLRKERNQTKKQSFLPLFFPLGSSIQIDHGEVDLEINNVRSKGYLFVASVPGQALRYCQVFPTKAQEAWGEFHERAFYFFGGLFPRVVYDNDSVLVKKVVGNERHQTDFSHSLEEQYGFESHFCNLASGNEKGAVENGVGYCRRNFLAGLPAFENWEEANHHLEKAIIQDISEGKHYKTNQPLHLIFKELKEKLSSLPLRMHWSKSIECQVDSCQLIRTDHHEYSVPEMYVGARVRVALGVFELKIFKDEQLIAKHQRQYDSSDSLDLNHYLDQLQYKANAFWDCKATQDHKFDQKYLEIWRRLSEKHTNKEGNRQFIKILLLRRHFPEKTLLKAIETGLKYGAIDHSAVKNIANQQETQPQYLNEERLKKELKEGHLLSWEFDLSPYGELCREVQS